MRETISLILGGGRGTRLFPLTKIRAKPAVPLAAKYRLIDIPISNCINSELNRIYVLTQFLSVSLHRHIRQTYRFDHFSGGFVELLAAQQTVDAGTDWYQGTADAVRKNLRYLEQKWVKHVLILSGDQLYRMDFRDMMQTHIDNKADVTIAGIPVTRSAAGSLGIMQVDDTGRVKGFVEKPQTDEEIDQIRTDPAWIDAHGIPSGGRDCLASMGLYIFDREVLVELLRQTTHEDFGKEVFPAAIKQKRVQLHLFDDYWEDIGTIRAFYEANLSLASAAPPFDLSSPQAPVYSRPRFLPPSVMEDAQVRGSLIADGCHIGRGTVIENSVIGLRTVIGENVTIRNSVVMGADYVQSAQEREQDIAEGSLPVGIGSGSTINGAILDKNCRIGRNVTIVNEQGLETHGEEEALQVRDSISIVIKNGLIEDGFKF
ncbi:glucose-1-phosphate adenylyltransferase [Planctomycetaceae bacterium SH139]